jgi:putative nucleotidyltransferase with HDIG domain
MSARDSFTHAHSRRVQRFAVALAGEADIRDRRMLEAIDAAALLHDIGKLGIPDQLLHKPGPLTAHEYDQVKQHAVIGADILSGVPFPGPLALIVRHHHENWDGSGYPDGLRGDAIPVGARVLAIVDCYDALTSDRPYRRSLSHDRAIAMIVERRGTMYEPAIADAFFRIVDELRQASDQDRAGTAPMRVPGSRWLARVI